MARTRLFCRSNLSGSWAEAVSDGPAGGFPGRKNESKERKENEENANMNVMEVKTR